MDADRAERIMGQDRSFTKYIDKSSPHLMELLFHDRTRHLDPELMRLRFAVGRGHSTVDRVCIVGLGGPHLGRIVRETPDAVDADAR